jgi:hypothetical protein
LLVICGSCVATAAMAEAPQTDLDAPPAEHRDQPAVTP